ncbi:ParB/RepB/Spo0J family partition protein [Opacimonas viscosa]|uniref:Probable chromosome-partitioning protein ParB n=1 Tax=Opacimonas viscosa TaxID=2961944 RepID=A0AA41WYK9_9ALTE|nr:ParB/RepB/Spo0J family partition protein [Opacimonas viscosa]MCP3428720.1 ParB/RepB/Spo0J family partition protein [Opacimonas viscosa]
MAGKHKGLGKGLDALLSSTRAAPTESVNSETSHTDNLRHLPHAALQPGKYQPRKDMSPEALDELAHSIQAQGVIQPIVVRPIGAEQYEIIAGERRWRAAQIAELTEVPCIIKDVADEAAVAIALIENIQREDLNAIEEAQALDRLMLEFSLTHAEVAEAVGKSRTTVTNLLRLNTLEEEVKKLLEFGDIEMGHARALLPLSGTAQIDAGRHVAGKGLSVRETENYIRRLNTPKTEQTKVELAPDLSDMQKNLTDKLGANVKIAHNAKGKGRVVIDFKDLEQLENLLQQISQ